MKENPLVSVVIAFYNEEDLLHEAIESVILQDYDNWELLLVDDGSIDQSPNIAKKYSEAYDGKISYLEHANHQNRGLSASRNLGIRHSKGDFVAFLDADDIWLPGKLSQQISIFRDFPETQMVAEPSLYWYSWSDSTLVDEIVPLGPTPEKLYAPPSLLLNIYPLSEGAAPCPSGLIVKREIFEITGLFEESFTKDYQLYEDQAFLNKVYLHCHVYISSACNNWYRQRPNSIVAQVTGQGKYHHVRRHFLEWYLKYAVQSGDATPQVVRLIKKNLLPYRHPTMFNLKNKAAEYLERAKKKGKKLLRKIIKK